VFVGKDVLELISSAMYIDPMSLYREYIQNSADAIDLSSRMSSDLGASATENDYSRRIEVLVDQTSRSVQIRDFASGISSIEFFETLLALGGSEKRGMGCRGFRGVGRLAGLAYAQELIFTSRASGEPVVSKLVWDVRALRRALRDSTNKSDVSKIIREVTTCELLNADGFPDSFFQVELNGVVRLRNDLLLNVDAVAEYLCQVAPVPFSPDFSFSNSLAQHFQEVVDIRGIDIRINSAEEPLYRPHRDKMMVNSSHHMVAKHVDFFEVPAIDSGRAAIGWLMHHDYLGAISKSALVAGLRLRVGNMQIGDDSTLREIFQEPRFNGWAIGEIHIIDNRIIPNGRRDHFENNIHFQNLANHLAPLGREIARQCRQSSRKRNLLKRFHQCADLLLENILIVEQGAIGSQAGKKFIETIKLNLNELHSLSNNEALLEEKKVLSEQLETLNIRLVKSLSKFASPAKPLRHMAAIERDTCQRLFELIFECSTNRVVARNLIERIIDRLEQSHENPVIQNSS